MDIDKVKTKVFIQYYQRLDVPKWLPIGPPILKGPKQVCSINPRFKNIHKLESKDCNKKPDQQSLRAVVKPVHQVKEWQKG